MRIGPTEEIQVCESSSFESSDSGSLRDLESSAVVSSEGGSLKVNDAELTCPPRALDDPVTIKLTLEEPCKYCELIVQSGLENDIIFGASIINCQPNGQKFKKPLTLTINLDKGKAPFKSLIVLHGTTIKDEKIFWEDITENSKFNLKKGEVTTNINRFSLIAVLLKLSWVHTKDILTRLNFMSFKYTLSVLFKGNRQNCPFVDELALVFMSQDIHQEQYYREHDDSALTQLKSDGFKELGSNVRQDTNYIYNRESLTVSIQLGEDYKPSNNQQERFEFTVDSSVWWSTGHVIKLPLQGSSADAKILCGKIVVQGQNGHVWEDHFCQLGELQYQKRSYKFH